MSPTIADAIEEYVRSGEGDMDCRVWPGNVIERAQRGHDDLIGALVTEVKRRAGRRRHTPMPSIDLTAWTRHKVAPMVEGLFPPPEREPVLVTLEKSVVFVTGDTFEKVLLGQGWLRTAWDLANLYLGSVGAKLLGPKAPSLVGLNEGTKCFVSPIYFDEGGRLEDFVIHEAAHIFHNCKRRTVGLPPRRNHEWLLPIEFTMRETFAYSCEAYGWIVEHATSRGERLAMAEEFAPLATKLTERRIDRAEVADIVREACRARSGWKVILGRCAEAKTARTAAALPGRSPLMRTSDADPARQAGRIADALRGVLPTHAPPSGSGILPVVHHTPALGDVYELRVTLRYIEPAVRRSVRVPADLVLGQLHDVLQAAFGWQNCHLHDFQVDDIRFGMADVEDAIFSVDEHAAPLGAVARAGSKLVYRYDPGDGWEHEVVVARVFNDGDETIHCTGGARACPPENCGGPPGYAHLIEVLANPENEEHADLKRWAPRGFNSETFDRAAVNKKLAAMSKRLARAGKNASRRERGGG